MTFVLNCWLTEIFTGAWYLSQGLIKGAQKAGEFFDSSTPKIIGSMRRSPQPAHIPQNLSKGVEIAETATNKAAQVTGFVGKLDSSNIWWYTLKILFWHYNVWCFRLIFWKNG